MKLRLPHKFQAALMAALASVTLTTLSTGSTAQAGTRTDYTTHTTEAGDVTYNGYVFTMLNQPANAFATRHFKVATYDEENSAWVDGEEYSSSNSVIDTPEGQGVFWTMYCSTATVGNRLPLGHTLRLSGATSQQKLETNFSDFTIGGLIADDNCTGRSLTDPAYWFYRTGSMDIDGAGEVNMDIDSYVMFSYRDAVNMKKGGTWNIHSGKMLVFDNSGSANPTTFEFYAGQALTVTGGGTLYLGRPNNGTYNVEMQTGSSLTITGNTTVNASVGAFTVNGSIVVDSGSLNVGTMTIAEGATVTRGSGGNVTGTLAGAGKYILPNGTSALGVTLGNSWSGTVRVGGFSFSNANLATTYTKNGSWVELYGITGGYLSGWKNGSESANIILTDPSSSTVAWKWSDGASNEETLLTLTGNIKGSGTFFKDTVDKRQGFKFTGDVHGWTGDFRAKATNNAAVTKLEFAGSSGQEGEPYEVNVGNISNEGVAALNVIFSTAGDVSVASNIKKTSTGAVNLTVANGTNATFAGTITNANTLTLAGNSTATFSKAVSAASLTVGDNRSTGATATFDGGLTLTGGLTLNGTDAKNASLTFNEDATVAGTFDMSNSSNTRGTVTVAGGKLLDITQTVNNSSIWMSSHATLALEKDARVNLGSSLTAKGLVSGGTVTVVGSNDAQYSLGASAYTFTNVEATIKTASSDVQLRFDNSKLVTSQTITLKNLQSVFSGMDIQGGTTTVGASDAGTVTLGAVTLSGGGNLALAEHVTGSVSSIDVTGTSAISGGTLSMGGTITTGDSAQLTLGGTVLFANGGITSSGTGSLAFGDSVVFDLSQLTEGENHTYTLFTGNAVDLTGLNATAADHITGVITTGRSWTFNNNGQVSYEILSRNLMWKQNGGAGIWTTDVSEQPWQISGAFPPVTTHFSDGDAVTFMYTPVPAVATLGSDINAVSLTVEASADATVNNGAGNTYALSVDVLNISGSLTTNTDIAVKSVTIENGGVWNMGGDLDLTAITYSNAGTLNVMDGATVNISKDTDTSVITGAGTLNLSVGTEVIQGYAPTFKAGSPFTGTLVYNEGNIGNHDSYVTLGNTFKGTLELRGRMNGHSMNLGGASTLRLVGDRSNNTTGIWSQGNNMTFNLNLEVTGDNTVDLWGDATTIINGTVNSGTVKQGHLNKSGNGTMTFNGAAALAEFTTPGGTVNFNSSAALDRININGGTVNLNGGAEADYSLGQAWLSGGSLAIGANGVQSLAVTDLVVKSSGTLSSAAAEPAEFNVTRFDISNFNTNFTLQNVELNVSGAATAAVLNTAQANDQATVTVGDKATLNLNGSVVWRKPDGAKTDYVNLTINDGGTVNVNGGTGNILNVVTVNAGGSLTFASNTGTEIAGTLVLADTITNAGNVTINSGSVAAGQVGTLTGTGAYTVNGTVAAAGLLKLDDITVTGGTENAAITGNMEIHGGSIGGTMTLGSSGSTIAVTQAFTVQADANLTVDGNVVLDALAPSQINYIGGEQDTVNNGFVNGVSVQVYNSDAPDILFNGTITYQGVKGAIYFGTFAKQAADYTTYFVNTATPTAETYSHAKAVADAAGGNFTHVVLAPGTSFNVDIGNATLNNVAVLDGDTAASLTIGSSASISSVTTGAGLTLTGGGTLALGTSAAAEAASLNGAGTLTINGPTVIINGTNKDYTSDIDVLSGTLKLGSSSDHARFVLGALNIAGQTPDRTITIGTGATLDINDKADANYIYTLQGGRLTNSGNGLGNGSSQTMGLIVNADSYVGQTGQNGEFWLRKSNAYSANPILTLNANLTKQGGSTFGLHNTAVTGTGAIVVQEGTLSFTGGTFASNLQLAGGTVSGTLNLAGSSVITTTAASTFSAAISTNGHGVTFNGDLNLAATGALTGNGGVTKNGTGTLELTTVNNYGGAFTVNAGKLLITTNGLPGTLTATGDGELHLRSAQGTDSQNVDLKTVSAANLHLVADAEHNSRFNYKNNDSNLNGVQNLYFDGGQLWLNGKDMTGGNKFTGNVTFNTTTYTEGTGNLNNAAIRASRSAEFSGSVTINNTARLTIFSGQTIQFSGNVGGSGNLELKGWDNNATFKVSGDASNYQGVTTSDSNITVHVTESGKMNLATGSNLAGTVQLDASGKMTVSGDSTISGAINGTGSLEVKEDATLKYNRTAETTVAAELSGEGTLQHTGSGTTNFTGDVSGFTGNVDVDAGTLNIMNIAEAAKLNVADVTIKNATMGVYNSTTATAETAHEGTLTIKDGSTLTASGENAKLNANLVMDSGSTLDVRGTNGLGLAMGSTVTLNTGMTLNDYSSDWSSWEDGTTYTLFTGVDGLNIGNGSDMGTAAIDYTQWVDASRYFENITESNRYFLCYEGAPAANAEGLLTGVGANGANVGMVYIMVMPEPTTGTLSLLALAALAARRRRK